MVEKRDVRNSGVQFSGCAEREAPRPAGLPVAMAKGIHLFPYRTQKLSPCAPMVLGWRRPGRVGRCRIPMRKRPDVRLGAFVYGCSPLHSPHTLSTASRQRANAYSRTPSPQACAPYLSALARLSAMQRIIPQTAPMKPAQVASAAHSISTRAQPSRLRASTLTLVSR